MVNFRNVSAEDFINFGFPSKKDALKYIHKYNIRGSDFEDEIEALLFLQEHKEHPEVLLSRKDFKFFNRELRKHRTINKVRGTFIQYPIYDKETLKEELSTYRNKYIDYFNDNYDYFVKRANKRIYYRNNNVRYANLQLFYAINLGEGDWGFRFTNSQPFAKDQDLNELRFNINSAESEQPQFYFIGYRILLITRDDRQLNNNLIYHLKAFNPSSDRKFHQLTSSSTNNNKLCIYETFLDINEIKTLKYMRKNKENHEIIKKMLKDEGEEIEKCVKNGELVKSLELLTKKYKCETVIVFYNSKIDYNKENYDKIEDKPIKISNGETCIINNHDEIKEYVNKKIILYEKNVHVAPAIFSIQKNDKIEKINKLKNEKYSLRPKNINNIKNNIGGIYGFDFETYPDYENNAVGFCITLVGHKVYNNNKRKKEENIKEVFYGEDCISNLIKYIDEISTKVNIERSRPKESIPKIYIYGFNNSRFDNLFFYEKFYELDPKTKYCFAGNSVKFIKYHNVRIYDISLQYKIGDLRLTAKSFGLEKEKGVYPYKFPNKDNLNYIGKIPDLKYWNSEEDYDECVKNLDGEKFDLKKYTIKYCLLDSELVYRIALKHIENCTGVINGKKYNVLDCPTSAKLSLKMFINVFLEEKLDQSPDKIVQKEKNAYKGGRTEMFKKMYVSKTDKRLYAYDRNSSYPASMTQIMPYKYTRSIVYKDYKLKIDEIKDHYLYMAKVEYKGGDKYIIPNILTRSEKGDIIACKKMEYSEQWGAELKEAILNGFDVYINEENQYEGKAIFKVFAEYFYNERLKHKNVNPAKELFFKNVLNSLYGKFGQKVFNKFCMCKDQKDINRVLKGDMVKLINFSIVKDYIMLEYKEVGEEYKSVGKLIRFASYISALSRCALSEIMRDVGHENIYYCDTDSIYTTKKPSDKFIDQKELGKWKLDTEPITKAIFIAPKCYYYVTEKGKIAKKAKGIRAKNLDSNNYEDLANGKKECIKQKSIMFFRSLENIKIIDQERTIIPVCNKRIWDNNDSIAFDNIGEWKNYKKKIFINNKGKNVSRDKKRVTTL